MIKFIVFCTKAIIALIIALLFSSCKFDFNNGIEGNGKVVTENRPIADKFTKVASDSGMEVIVEQADQVMVEVEADDNIVKHITTKVKDGELIVSTDESIESAQAMVVRVKMPVIEGLKTSSGSNIKTNSTIKGVSLEVKSSSGSEIDATVEYESVSSESSSGSNLKLAGKSLKFSAESSSGSEIDAAELIANDIKAQASSGSSVETHALVSLNGKASSGGSVRYKGTPKSVTKEETSGGSVSKN